MQFVFVNFSTNIAPIGTKLGTRSQWAPTMLVLQLNGGSRVFWEHGLGVDTILEKAVFFDTFFHKSAKRVDTTNVAAGSVVLTRCPTSHNTATSPQLAVPVRFKAVSVLQFRKISVISSRSDVETSESFSQLWLALGSPNFRH